MANTYVDYTAVASQTDYNFSFEYLRDEHVKVKVDDVIVTNYTIITSPVQLIRFDTAPTASATIKIYRDSRGDFSPLVDFVNGSVLTESELDESYKHNLFVSQESSEGTGGEQLTKKGLTNYDAEGNKIINLGSPTTATDAATKSYVDQTIDNAELVGGSPATVSLGVYDVTSTNDTLKQLRAWTADIETGDKSNTTVTATGSTTARTLADRFADVVNVLDFIPTSEHAAIKNSTSTYDASSAFQDAIDTGKRVYVPAGTYLVDDLTPLTSNGYLNMFGEKGKSELKATTGTRSAYGIISTGVVSNDGLLILDGLIFNNYQYGIHYFEAFTYDHEAYITNCTFKESSIGVGLRSDNLQKAVITDCHFENITDDEISGNSAIMLGNINTTDYDVGEYFVVDNTFDTVTSTSAECHAIWVSGNTATISRNRIKEVQGSSPGDGAEAIYNKVRNVYIDGNIIFNGGHGQGAITIKGDCLIARITNNQITGSTGSTHARSAFYAGGVENLVISGNYVETLGGTDQNGQVVWITSDYTYCEFSKNVFTDCTGSSYTIRFEPSSGMIKIFDNTVNMSSDSVYGWWVDPNGGTFDSVVYDGNVSKITASNLSSGSVIVCRIRFGQTTSTYKNVSITNNTIVANDFTGVTTTGISLNSPSGGTATIDKMIIEGNTVSGTADTLFTESWHTATNIVNIGNTWNSEVKTVTNDATPSLDNGNRIFKSANVTPTKNITDFDASQDIGAGTQVTLLISDAFTQVDNGSGILLNGAANFKPTNGGSLTLMYDGTNWIELGRNSY